MIDNLLHLIKHRIDAYAPVVDLFGFLHQLRHISAQDTQLSATKLITAYPDDFENGLSNELIQFASFLNLTDNASDSSPVQSVELGMLSIVSKTGIRELFPNVDTLLRIYLTIPVTNCSGERSFSTLKRVKNTLRTSTSDERLNHLSLMCIESELLKGIDFTNIISDFAKAKARKVML